jgi:hypothetical protein
VTDAISVAIGASAQPLINAIAADRMQLSSV